MRHEHYIQDSHMVGDKQTYTALLIRSEIAFDINFFTYKTARITFAEVKNADRKEVVIAKDTADWLDRHITSAISKIRKRISFACPRTSRMASDEILDSASQFPIALAFSREWDGDPQVLCDTIHDFVVKQCLADWSQYALTNRFDEFQNFANLTLEEIHDLACSYTMDDYGTGFMDTPVGLHPTPPQPISADHSQELLDAKEALIKATDQIKGKQDALVSGKTLKTINGQSLLGEGNIEIKTSTATPIPTEVDAYTKQESDSKYQPKGTYLTEHQKLKTINGQTLTGEGNIEIQGGTDAYTKSESDTKYVAKQAGKVLSSNDYTDTDKAKVASAITSHQSLEGKQDKLTAQQLANLNADHSQYLTSHQDISGKVDKVTGKGLSTNDYTNDDKSAVQNIAELSLNQGTLADLTTTDKTSLVKAINEVNAKPSGGYTKPTDGIPKTDLASSVQTSLGLADTAIQSVKTINGESIVGRGNITIQGGSGSSEWTKLAEFSAPETSDTSALVFDEADMKIYNEVLIIIEGSRTSRSGKFRVQCVDINKTVNIFSYIALGSYEKANIYLKKIDKYINVCYSLHNSIGTLYDTMNMVDISTLTNIYPSFLQYDSNNIFNGSETIKIFGR